MRKKTKRNLIIVAAAFLCLVLATVYTVGIRPLLKTEKWMYKEVVVERGNLTVGVTESGTLDYGETSQNYDLNVSVTTESDDDDDDSDDEETVEKYLKVEEVYVAIGQRIQEGDEIVKFTDSSVNAVRKLLTGAKTDAEVAYSEALSEYNLSALTAKLNYQSDVEAAKYANSIYTNTKQSVLDQISELEVELQSYKDKINDLQDAYDDLYEDYDKVVLDYGNKKYLMEVNAEKGTEGAFVTSQENYIQAKSTYDQLIKNLDQATTNIKNNANSITETEAKIVSLKASSSIDQLEAKQTYEDNKITGEIAETEYNSDLLSLKETLEDTEADMKEAQEKLQEFEDFVGENGIVYAKGSGIVTEVGYEAGDTLVNSGVVVSFAKEEDMTMSVDVSQEDIVNLSVGDSVNIVFSAYEDKVYEGKIISIETTNTANGSTVSYPVVISVLGDTSELYGGMTANITFVTEEKEDVLYISKKAIVEKGAKKYVYIDGAGGKKELTEVATGLSNGVSVEIVSGLSEGDICYIASKVSSEENVEKTSEDGTSEDRISGDGTSGEGTSTGDNQNGGFPDGDFQSKDFSGEFPSDVPSGDFSGGGFPGGGNFPGGNSSNGGGN